jgi:predicted CXXCH cytochrome family protein
MTKKIGIAVAGSLAALLPLAMAFASIQNSKHDLSSANSGAAVRASTTNQICIFCHTPHKAGSQQLLWNHKAGTVTGFSAGQVTAAGTTLPTAISGSSQRCLGCHDGTTGVGDVFTTDTSGTTSIGMTGADVDPTTGKITNSFYIVGNGSNLDTNHPVGIPYPGQSGSYNSILSAAITGYNTTASVTAAGLKLFNDGTAGSVLGVECASCHDVHNSAGVDKLLWIDNTASALCLKCHDK